MIHRIAFIFSILILICCKSPKNSSKQSTQIPEKNYSISINRSKYRSSKCRIAGKVTDVKADTAVPYCQVRLFDNSGELVAGAISDRFGNFELYALPDKFQLSTHRIGFSKLTVPIDCNLKKGDEVLMVLRLKAKDFALYTPELKQ